MEPPEQVTLRHALHDLGYNRLAVGVMAHWGWCLAAYLVVGCVLSQVAPDYLLVLVAPPLLVAVALAAYLVAERRFHARLRKRRPRCLACKRLIWQAQCGRCRLPVPQLGLLFGGLFLRHCPHCEAQLTRESLRAWCHACGAGVPDALAHYRRAMFIEIEVSAALPDSNEPYQEFHHTTPTIGVIVLRMIANEALLANVPSPVLESVTRLWFDDKGVTPLARRSLLASIPPDSRPRITLLFQARHTPADIEDEWGEQVTDVARPSGSR